MPESLYRYIWKLSGGRQVLLCLLTLAVVGLSALPLELQRRIVDGALGGHDGGRLLLLSAVYLALLLVQGGLKYLLNLQRGIAVEVVTRDLRGRVFARLAAAVPAPHPAVDRGALVSMAALEVEDVAGFAGESISTPLQQAGTALAVLSYLAWVEPLIASFALVVYLPEFALAPVVQRWINRLARHNARLVRRLGDTIVAAGEGQAGRVARRFSRLVDRSYEARLAVYRRKYFLTFLGNFLDALGPLLILSVGGWLVVRGRTEVATLVVFISGFGKVSDPLDQLVTFYRGASNARVKYALFRDTLSPSAAQITSPSASAGMSRSPEMRSAGP